MLFCTDIYLIDHLSSLRNPSEECPRTVLCEIYLSLVECPGAEGTRRIHYIHSLHQSYGSVVRIAPAEVATSDFESFREIHRIKSGYLKSP